MQPQLSHTYSHTRQTSPTRVIVVARRDAMGGPFWGLVVVWARPMAVTLVIVVRNARKDEEEKREAGQIRSRWQSL